MKTYHCDCGWMGSESELDFWPDTTLRRCPQCHDNEDDLRQEETSVQKEENET